MREQSTSSAEEETNSSAAGGQPSLLQSEHPNVESGPRNHLQRSTRDGALLILPPFTRLGERTFEFLAHAPRLLQMMRLLDFLP